MSHVQDMTTSSTPVSPALQADLERILDVWEAAVRATHTFLEEQDIQNLTPIVKEVIARVSALHCLRNSSGVVFAFMIVIESRIEMLFVHPDYRGQGAGRRLIVHAVDRLGAWSVDVNEQNVQAVGFYEHMGFRRISRSERDPLGNPYPILHMVLHTHDHTNRTPYGTGI